MGLFACSYHSDTGIALVCPDIEEAIRVRKILSEIITLFFRDEKESDRRFKVYLELKYCSVCAEVHGFPRENSTLPRKQLDGLYKAIVFSAVCNLCLADAQ